MAKGKSKNDIVNLKLKETINKLKKTMERIERNIETLDDVDDEEKRASAGNNMKENIEKGRALTNHLRDIIHKAKKENKVDEDGS
jgi:CTP-dependent riboflavin kinase